MSSSAIDAARLFRDIESHGLSRTEIAPRAGVSKSTVWRLGNDANRDHLNSTVKRIERLHEQVLAGEGNGTAGGGPGSLFHGKPSGP